MYLFNKICYNNSKIIIAMDHKYDMKATTILIVRHEGKVVIGADSQGTIGSYIASTDVQKIRSFRDGSILMGFAGLAKDGIAMYEMFEKALKMYNYDLRRACSEIAKDFRNGKINLREAVVLIADKHATFRFTGSGELTKAENICAIGSGSLYALCAGKALLNHAKHLTAEQIVKESMTQAGELCLHTNLNIKIKELNNAPKKDKRSVLTKSDLPMEVDLSNENEENTTVNKKNVKSAKIAKTKTTTKVVKTIKRRKKVEKKNDDKEV